MRIRRGVSVLTQKALVLLCDRHEEKSSGYIHIHIASRSIPELCCVQDGNALVISNVPARS